MRALLGILVVLVVISSSNARTFQVANITSVIASYGYKYEVHQTTTTDGFILTLFRIPNGRATPPPARKGVVLLQHGLTDSAAGWCLNAPTESLSYILADAGYDVWLGNNRGNGYSMQAVNTDPTQPDFWAFSWDEMALYDFPATINYVLQTTGSSKISYIGHSEGTIQAFAGLISNPAIANKLNIFIALAPVAYVGHITVEIMQILAHLDAEEILELLGVYEMTLPGIIHKLLPEGCWLDPTICQYGGDYFYGQDSFLNSSRLDYYTIYEPFPTSVQNIAHWAQGVATSTFQKFDYGTQGNIAHYGQPTPPPYDLSKFPSNLTTALFTGGIDGLADPADVQILLNSLSFTPMVYNRADYGHLDPLIGYDADTMTYPTILQLLGKYSPN